MVSRFLDWLDESAAGVIRVAYLLAGVIAVASYFSDGRVPSGLARALGAVLPWALAGALEIHTYLTARRVRRAYQDRRAASPGSDEHDRAESDMRVNLWILAGLLTFSIYNQLQYLASTWTPPHTPLTPPGPFPYLIRAIVTPAAFMAAAFLAPVGEGLAVQVQAEAHRLAALAFKAARAQWKRQLRDMARTGQDVTAALVQLVDDPTERRVIETIHQAMHPDTSAPVAPTAANVAARSAIATMPEPSASAPETPDRPPTGPGSPTVARKGSNGRQPVAPVLQLPAPRGSRRAAAQGRASRSNGGRSNGGSREADARHAWAEGHRTVTAMEKATGMSRNSASKWVKTLKAENSRAQ